jgi:hypothetical protein
MYKCFYYVKSRLLFFFGQFFMSDRETRRYVQIILSSGGINSELLAASLDEPQIKKLCQYA